MWLVLANNISYRPTSPLNSEDGSPYFTRTNFTDSSSSSSHHVGILVKSFTRS